MIFLRYRFIHIKDYLLLQSCYEDEITVLYDAWPLIGHQLIIHEPDLPPAPKQL